MTQLRRRKKTSFADEIQSDKDDDDNGNNSFSVVMALNSMVAGSRQASAASPDEDSSGGKPDHDMEENRVQGLRREQHQQDGEDGGRRPRVGLERQESTVLNYYFPSITTW